MRIVFVGGGTGGHFYPLIATAEALLSRAMEQKQIPPDLFYIGPDKYDENALFTSGITFIQCPAGKLRRYHSFKNISDVCKTIWGIIVAFWKLLIIYPDVVMSKGGYTSVPVIIAAWLLRIPIVVHESDAVPGRANRLGVKFATYIAITYDDTIAHVPQEKTALTGIPIRRELLAPAPTNSRELLKLTSDKPLIFITGGSSGAERINDLIISALNDLLPEFEVIHQTGSVNEKVVRETARVLVSDTTLLQHYHVYGFMDANQLHAAESEAVLVISRAGSTSIYEIALHGKPAILIPIPEEISHDQRTNAYAYARTGAGEVIEEKNLTPHLLVSEITRIMGSPEIQEKMRTAALKFGSRDAALRIADILVTIGRSHE